MLEKFKELLKKEKKELKLTSHIALTMDGIASYAKKEKIPLSESYKKSFDVLLETLDYQIDLRIPITTFFVLPEEIKADVEAFSQIIDPIEEFFNGLVDNEAINKNKVKISVLGKWYGMPGRVVEVIKKAIDATKDYDEFFMNLCINYDGQEEIVDACKLISMQIRVGKIDPESINKELIKDSIYSSSFLPPDLVIINGKNTSPSGLLLWDSVNSKVYFSNKLWPLFDKSDLNEAIKEYQKE